MFLIVSPHDFIEKIQGSGFKTSQKCIKHQFISKRFAEYIKKNGDFPRSLLGKSDFPRSHVVPWSLGGALENSDFPRSHVVPGSLGGALENDDFPRSHVVPEAVGAVPLRRRFFEAVG